MTTPDFSLPAEWKEKLHELSREIHDHPELAMQEFHAFELQVKLLEDEGFTVQKGISGLQTAYRVDKVIGNGNGPVLAFFSEFDALAKIGHACGHNLICASGIGAFLLAVRELERAGLNGKLVLFGAPGEEGKSGKVFLCNDHQLDGVDAALISHPYDLASTDSGAYSVRRFSVKFHGKASHAGMAPEQGINALDAMILFFNGIGLWRQQLKDATRVHGIILKGGEAANIIPDETEAFFYLRARDPETGREMARRFREIVEGAAKQTGCTFDCDYISGSEAIKVNAPLNRAYAEYMESIGEPVIRATGTEGTASTDFGDVSQLVPGANLHFGICHEGGMPLHCEAFRDTAGTDFAFEQAMKCSCAMAQICYRFFSDDKFHEEVIADFKR